MKKIIKVGSDFSGVGAFDQALRRLQIEHETVFACDMDKFARQTYIHNYGEPSYYPKNVYDREITKDSLDIYMTSPPCQAFSMNGKRLGKNDEKGILFFNSHDFIMKNKPRFFIFENVEGLLSDDNGRTFQEWINHLGGKSVNGLPVLFPTDESAPYHIYWKVLNAKDYGIPQNRKRVFIVGIRDDQDNIFSFPATEPLNKKISDVIDFDLKSPNYVSKKVSTQIIIESKNGLYKIKSASLKGFELASEKNDSVNYTFPSSKTRKGRVGKGISQTLDTACNQGIIINGRIRRLTPRECFRLMDFPDSFTWSVSDSQAYKQAGNSIVVRCLELIISKLKL